MFDERYPAFEQWYFRKAFQVLSQEVSTITAAFNLFLLYFVVTLLWDCNRQRINNLSRTIYSLLCFKPFAFYDNLQVLARTSLD
ncbi:hypothetical protein [Zooshikella sp. RANM57]|uniref:hypothetical protein n=1 Tax=Zooshikella sp. RANM57 TaxID=3425863 RepID=UPI003D6F32FA